MDNWFKETCVGERDERNKDFSFGFSCSVDYINVPYLIFIIYRVRSLSGCDIVLVDASFCHWFL